MEERRESLRVSCRLEIETKAGKNWFMLNSENIGVDGMMLTCKSEVEKLKKLGIDAKQNVLLSFYLPDRNDLVKVSGMVVYVKRKANPIDGSEASFIGVKFKDVSDHTNEQLESLMSYKGKKPFI